VCVCESELGSPGWREPLDCVRASELCNQNGQCSSRYRIMRQCLSGGDKERSTMLASKECQGALEVLQDSPLYDCRCKRGMKKELQCLQNYWSIHMGLTEGEEFYETSPYEPIHFSEEFRHASIISVWNELIACPLKNVSHSELRLHHLQAQLHPLASLQPEHMCRVFSCYSDMRREPSQAVTHYSNYSDTT
ncbi:GDNF family receptor alpha-2-like, partial [Cottoperca gobio]|uniref:GDNF family receptor alpha-2-like n=1 Tax=Cottoperca gobio TaxID=56716 RepID=A0A6J2QV59_COTGO